MEQGCALQAEPAKSPLSRSTNTLTNVQNSKFKRSQWEEWCKQLPVSVPQQLAPPPPGGRGPGRSVGATLQDGLASPLNHGGLLHGSQAEVRRRGWRNTPDSSCAAAAQHLNRISGNYGSCTSPRNALIGWKKYRKSQTCLSEEPLERRFNLFAFIPLIAHRVCGTVQPLPPLAACEESEILRLPATLSSALA